MYLAMKHVTTKKEGPSTKQDAPVWVRNRSSLVPRPQFQKLHPSQGSSPEVNSTPSLTVSPCGADVWVTPFVNILPLVLEMESGPGAY